MKTPTILICIFGALVFSCNGTDGSKKVNALSGYSIHWKYRVKTENKKVFEFEYGLAGTWCKLFKQSQDYKGSFLQRSNEDSEIYLLMDTWTTEESYESFKELHREEYQELSRRFQTLYASEEKSGTFISVE